jgi:hypothetical protein
MATSTGGQLFRPSSVRFGNDTVPAKLVFKEPGVAVRNAIGSPELDEISKLFETESYEHEKVLVELSLGVLNRCE